MWMTERGIDALSTTGAFEPNLLQTLAGDHLVLGTVFLAGGLVVESLGWMLWYRRTRPFITLALVGLHAGIAAVLDIWFWLNVAVLLCVGMPWSLAFDAVRTRLARHCEV